MFSILSNRTLRYLFAAQVMALIGTGLATVALWLLAGSLREMMPGWSFARHW